MDYVKLGKTGALISRMCLGTMNFGMVTDKEEAFKIMDVALDRGINFIDTSNSYGGYNTRGLSEKIIGGWFEKRKTRNRVILADKVYHISEKSFYDPNDEKGLSAYKIRRHIEESLLRLGTDRIELYQMHHTVQEVDWNEIWREMNRLYYDGRIIYVGSSNFSAYDIAVCNGVAKENGNTLGLVSEQHRYNLLCRLPELEIIPACRKAEMSLLVWGPLSAGRLGNEPFNRNEKTRSSHNEFDQITKDKVNQYTLFCESVGILPAEMALAWILANHNVGSVIIGPRNVEQLESCLKAIEIDIHDYMPELNKIFPGYNEAPEEYAW